MVRLDRDNDETGRLVIFTSRSESRWSRKKEEKERSVGKTTRTKTEKVETTKRGPTKKHIHPLLTCLWQRNNYIGDPLTHALHARISGGETGKVDAVTSWEDAEGRARFDGERARKLAIEMS